MTGAVVRAVVRAVARVVVRVGAVAVEVGFVVVVAAIAHNIHIVQCLLHWMVGGGGGGHQKQHYVPYCLSIVLILSLKNAFWIISMLFTLVRCSIILLRLLLTYCIHVSYLMSKFIAFLYIFSCPLRNVPYGKSCLL